MGKCFMCGNETKNVGTVVRKKDNNVVTTVFVCFNCLDNRIDNNIYSDDCYRLIVKTGGKQ